MNLSFSGGQQKKTKNSTTSLRFTSNLIPCEVYIKGFYMAFNGMCFYLDFFLLMNDVVFHELSGRSNGIHSLTGFWLIYSLKVYFKCTCKFILSVVSWKVKLLSKAKRLKDKKDILQCTLLNMTVSHSSTRYFALFVYTCLYTNTILNSYAIAFKMKLSTKIIHKNTFESIYFMSMSFDIHWVIIPCE